MQTGESGDLTTAGNLQQKILDVLGEEYKSDEWSDEAVYDSLPLATKHGEVIQKVEQDQDKRDESKKRAQVEKAARLERLRLQRAEAEAKTNSASLTGSKRESETKRHHSAPAGEIGGYYPGESTLPPPRSPVTAFLRVAKPTAGAVGENEEKKQDRDEVNVKETKESKGEEDIRKKIYDAMMKKHTE